MESTEVCEASSTGSNPVYHPNTAKMLIETPTTETALFRDLQFGKFFLLPGNPTEVLFFKTTHLVINMLNALSFMQQGFGDYTMDYHYFDPATRVIPV